MKKKAIVSACLLGELCRYDGKTKEVNAVREAFKEYEIIPFCPEAPLFGTPRQRISVVKVDGVNRIITDETKEDVTLRLEAEIQSFMKRHEDVDKIVLKSKSPSCGNGTTPILNQDRDIVEVGDGIAVRVFKSHYKSIKIEDEILFT